MLILAGVSINMVVGDDGILTRAQQGSIKTQLAAVADAINLSMTSNQTEYMAQFSESTAMVGSKNTYLTVARLNQFCDGVKLLESTGSNYSFTLNGSTVTIAVGNTFGANSSLATACGANSGTNGGSTPRTSTTSASGYVTRVLYFSDGASGTNLGSNLYIAAIHFENGFFKVDDVGVIRSAATATLTQGQTFAHQNDSTRLGSLDVEWLKGVNK